MRTEIEFKEKKIISSRMYLLSMIAIILFINLFAYIRSIDYLIQIKIQILIIVSFTAIFHFILQKPFYYLRGKKEEENYAEHYFWFLWGLLHILYIHFVLPIQSLIGISFGKI